VKLKLKLRYVDDDRGVDERLCVREIELDGKAFKRAGKGRQAAFLLEQKEQLIAELIVVDLEILD